MWQFVATGSLIAGAFESIADKAGIVRGTTIDSTVATFYRVFFFILATVIVGMTGLIGTLEFVFHWSFIPIAAIGVVSSLLFTYLLRNVEITSIVAASYTAPFLFLFIDTHIVGIDLTRAQVIGIILLIFGGIAFALDGKTHRFRKEFTWKVAAAFAFMYIVSGGIESYTFKHLNETTGMSPVSFYTGIWAIGVVMLLAIVIVRGKWRLLYSRAARTYVPYAAIGKSFDAVNSMLYLTAISFATVSQVSAFSALLPLAIFLLAEIAQGMFRIRLHEHLDHKRSAWKLGAAIVLIVGGILVA